MTERNKGYLLSGELARLSGVSADTIRNYERKGLLQKPERSGNGYRRYPVEALARVRMIRSALSVGFTIAEIAGILRIRNKGGNPCHKVHQIAHRKLVQIEDQIQALNRAKNDLQICLQEWDRALATTAKGERALLLEKLADKHSFSEMKLSPMLPSGLKKKKEKFS